MWVFTLMTLSCGFIARVMSNDIEVNCHRKDTLPPSSVNAAPSLLGNLSVEVKGDLRLHIQWAVTVDVSTTHLTGTRILVDEDAYLCEYTPPFANANLTGLTQLWFKYDVDVTSAGQCEVYAANLPLPPVANGLAYKSWPASLDEDEESFLVQTQSEPMVSLGYTQKSSGAEGLSGDTHEGYTSPLVALLGAVMAGSIALASCLIFLKAYRSHISGSGYFRKLPISTQTPVSVLLVYPAECPAFQKTVVALAEFLQEHGGCSVAVDFWQQGKIAELGPMRWAAGQAKAADRVLVVCPQPISCRSNHSFLGPSIPASANDLYPLVLNMVASHAKDPSELAMFWAVQLGKGERPRSLPGEMTACKFFSLTKDLDKLCRSLHNKRQDSSIPQRPEMLYNKKSTMKLQDAIGQLAVHRSSITVEQERLNSVAIIV